MTAKKVFVGSVYITTTAAFVRDMALGESIANSEMDYVAVLTNPDMHEFSRSIRLSDNDNLPRHLEIWGNTACSGLRTELHLGCDEIALFNGVTRAHIKRWASKEDFDALQITKIKKPKK